MLNDLIWNNVCCNDRYNIHINTPLVTRYLSDIRLFINNFFSSYTDQVLSSPQASDKENNFFFVHFGKNKLNM